MLDELMGCLAPCFARVEPRRQARKYITGLISDLPRKNCWTLAEQAGDVTPDKMQRLLERASWDTAAVMAAVRAFAVVRLGDPLAAVLVLDESGQEKAGEHTAGVKRQYLGCAGRVANGINVVFASYAAPAGHAVIEARLYVPKDWAGDRERCQAAGLPGDLEFATKPALAAEIVTLLLAERSCPPWVTGDEVYGRDAKLRTLLEDRLTACSNSVTTAPPIAPVAPKTTCKEPPGSVIVMLLSRHSKLPGGRASANSSVSTVRNGPHARAMLDPPDMGGGGRHARGSDDAHIRH
jgi:SRSO17 transposase